MGGQVHSAEPFGSAGTIYRTVPAADVAGDVYGGAQEVATAKAMVLATCGGGAIHVIAGRVGHAGGGGEGPPRYQVIGAHVEEEACGSRQELVSGER